MRDCKDWFRIFKLPFFIIHFTVWFSAIYIQSCSSDEEDKTSSSLTSQSENKKDTLILHSKSQSVEVVGERTIDWQKFEKVYSFADSDGLGQKLGVNWTTSNSIQYQIASHGIMCDMELHGKAKNKYPNMDMEFDNDTSDETYQVNEYTYSNKQYTLSIRIETTKGQRARFTFTPQKHVRDEECDPDNGFILRLQP